jgi:two-component system, sensor histidine kinase YesM
MRIATFSLCYLVLSCFHLAAQDTLPGNSPLRQSNNDILRNADPLKETDQLGPSCEQLAKNYFEKGALAKAETYYKCAYQYYLQYGRPDDALRMLRSLAQTQEAQGKTAEAEQSFSQTNTLDVRWPESNNIYQLNLNDAQRLGNTANPSAQEPYILNSIKIAQQKGDPVELANAYRQLGDANLRQDKKPQASQYYQNALAQSADPIQSVQLGQQIATAYTSKGQWDDALAVQQQVLQQDILQQNPALKIQQIQQLATLYEQRQQKTEALNLLKNSYYLAIREHRTLDAKYSLEKMAALYVSLGNQQASLTLYRQFLSQLDSLMLADPSIVDARLLAATEEKVTQLERDKTLQSELIRRKNRFNYMLLGASTLLLGLVLIIVRALRAIQTQNKKIALQSLRREMNPHFVFNSLNSINHFIAQNQELEANKFLSAYSHLMRSFMENSNNDFVSLNTELEMLRKYLELEQMRFPDKLAYQIVVDEAINPDTTQFPNMILQPLLENAIWHGLRYKTEKGQLLLEITLTNGHIVAKVEDNGIGLAQSQALKTAHQMMRPSIGLVNVQARIALLNQLYGTYIHFELNDKIKPGTGAVARISLKPLISK